MPLRCVGDEALPLSPDEGIPLAWLDKPRDYLSERFVSLSASMDDFFADERVFDESRTSFLRVYGDLSYKEAQASDFTIKVQAKLVLPALEKRMKLLIESDDSSLDGNGVNSISTPSGVPNVDVPKDFRAAVPWDSSNYLSAGAHKVDVIFHVKEDRDMS